jgi:hypothetical protein
MSAYQIRHWHRRPRKTLEPCDQRGIETGRRRHLPLQPGIRTGFQQRLDVSRARTPCGTRKKMDRASRVGRRPLAGLLCSGG